MFNLKRLEEHEDDPPYFKGTILKNECPVIHSTLQNKRAKELDKYRRDFNSADPKELLNVVYNITLFANDYIYKPTEYETINDVDSFQLSGLAEEDYIVYGVIGGGIQSQFLYKLRPDIFPNRSRDAVWALWYLTNKKEFSCKEGSEFLMIDVKKSITQQNFFYPYDLFSYYALKIYLLLKKEAERENIEIPVDYRYVILDSFLKYVAQQHSEEITILKQAIKDDCYDY